MNKINTIHAIRPSVRALMAESIDYAGLFPPSAVSMPEAVLNYATYRNSNYSWMLGRFVVSASRLTEFAEAAADFVSRDAGSPWQIAVVFDGNLAENLAAVDSFNEVNGERMFCDSVEMKASSGDAIASAAAALPSGVSAFFELALDQTLPELVAEINLAGQQAKIRTGGVTPEAFPKTTEIVKFVRTCLAANVPFKATAGLHHPIRCFRPLTYEANSVQGTMHGFLNLFLMTGFAREGFRTSFLEDVMEEEFEEVFAVEDQSIIWRTEFSLNTFQLEQLRAKGIRSFGSCSFDEPVADLQKLGIL
ncbi:MAG: hypothetical protein IPM50_06855 [Acidobacteriota bacterium]|nr:MAG: hypothetical protein IPM50_06855 [Acidobacteriota bacterium]